MKNLLFLLLLIVALIPVGPVIAQDGPQPQRVEVVAQDGLVLIGDFYLPPESTETGAPAIVLLHMASSSRHSWEQIIPELTEAGYVSLSIDMRGHGETQGSKDWVLAEQDIQIWIDWLRQQPGVDPARINFMGASFGANLALRGMANDEAIVTAIALSPALDFVGMTTEDAIETIDNRPVFMAVAQDDAPCNKGVKTLAGLVKGQAIVRYYRGNGHGLSLFNNADLLPMIISWLDMFNQPPQA